MTAHGEAGPRRESLSRGERLLRRADYLRCYRRGRRRHGSLFTVYVVARQEKAGSARLGITVSRKVGSAVVRNRIKRRLREIYRRWSGRGELPAADLLIHVRPAAAAADFAALAAELERLLRLPPGRGAVR